MAMLTAVRRRRNGGERATSTWIPVQRQSDPVSPGVSAPPSPSQADLALNLPGETARAQVLQRRQAAPVRTALARALRVPTDERAWRLDADGEAKVAAMLAQLDPRWRVLHAIPVGERRGEIDHVVIGPTGVYILSARHHPGASVLVAGDLFMVDGRRHTYTDLARRQALDATARLTAACGFSVHATAVVVPVGADQFLVKRQPLGVGVVPRARVNRWLNEQTATLSPSDVAAIYAAARRSDVWQ